MINLVVLFGEVVRTPVLRHTSSGTSVTNFEVKVKTRAKVNAIPVTLWEGVAEFASSRLRQGDQILLRGELQIRPQREDYPYKEIVLVAKQVSVVSEVEAGEWESSDDVEESGSDSEFEAG